MAAADVAIAGLADGAAAGADPIDPQGAADSGAGVDTGVDPVAADPCVDPDAAADPSAAVDPAQLDPNAVGEDGRQIPAQFKELFKVAGNKPLKDAWFTAKAYQKEFPEGIKGARELKATFAELGGADGITAMKSEVAEWQGLDQAFEAGDPKFVDEVAASNPEAFAKHMPRMIDKFAELNPEEYSRHMSAVIQATFNDYGIPQAMWKASQLLTLNNANSTEEAKKILTDVDKWMNSFGEAAKKPAAQPQNTDAKLTEQQQQLATREAALFNKGVALDFNAHRTSVLDAEIAKYTKGAKVDQEKLDVFKANVIERIKRANEADPQFKATFEKYYGAGDKDGLVKFMKSRFDDKVVKAVEAATRIVPLVSAAPKPPVKPTDKPAANPAPPKGVVRLSGPPKIDDIDRSKTNSYMIQDGQAILKDGRKVYWKDKVPA